MRRMLGAVVLAGLALGSMASPVAAKPVTIDVCDTLNFLSQTISAATAGAPDTDTFAGLTVAATYFHSNAQHAHDKASAAKLEKVAAAVRKLAAVYEADHFSQKALDAVLSTSKKLPHRCKP